ncbi:MAG: FecR domain-containing protein [Desulfuromonadaceae bacterium]|nr:FecR domain-containing protein [Desulfuromonadaceae bacterium]MDD2856709.1 FecR domain-containing protein [Desulfuromonadaceae bacterium]
MALNSNRFQVAIINIIVLLFFVSTTFAASGGVGTVTHLSGPLFGKKGDGAQRVLSINSAVEQGDTLVAEKRTYGRVKFTDGGEVTLRPGTVFVVESYVFNKDKPADDKAVFSLLKGSLRAVTGQVSKRGNVNAYKMKAPTATIGVRGTSYDMKICDGNCPGLSDGIYFYVTDGAIEVSNGAGSVEFGAGTYGYVMNDSTLPVLLPFEPSLGLDIAPLESSSCGVR